jgi:hypothetical protein
MVATMRLVLLLLSACLTAVASAVPPHVTVTQCAQEVPRGFDATLANDLDCSAELRCWHCDGSITGTRCRPGLQACTTSADCPPPTCPDSENCIGPSTADYSFCASTAGVVLDRADLDLAGYTIAGGYAGVICLGGRCRVGNGTISGNWNAVQNSGKLELTDLVLSDNGNRAVEFSGTPVRPVRATRVTVADNGNDQAGLVGSQVTLIDVSLYRTGSGVLGFKSIKGIGVTAIGDANTRVASSALATYDGKVSINGFFARDWRRAVDTRIVVLRDADLADNECDVFSRMRPTLTNTTCQHSCQPTAGTWGLCSED